MQPFDPDKINEQKLDRIETLLEQLALDTVLTILYRLTEKHKLLPTPICYKVDCPQRDEIPF